MAIREIEINTDSLGRDIESLRGALDTIRKDKNRMVEEISQLSTMWKGPANQAFVKQFSLDCISFDNLIQTIEEMIRAMENAKKEYEKCDRKVIDIANTVKVP